MPSRRTITVLSSLLAAMTLASAMLLMLEPSPATPWPAARVTPTLQGEPIDLVFDTTPPLQPRRWSSLLVHFSGTRSGSADTMNRLHEQQGLGGLAYHFVIGNGQGAGDGQIEIGYRWRHQLDGMSPLNGQADRPRPDRHVIDICLVGDGSDQPPTEAQFNGLVWLVQQLQARLAIPADRVHVNEPDAAGGSAAFPLASFRQQLLTSAAP